MRRSLDTQRLMHSALERPYMPGPPGRGLARRANTRKPWGSSTRPGAHRSQTESGSARPSSAAPRRGPPGPGAGGRGHGRAGGRGPARRPSPGGSSPGRSRGGVREGARGGARVGGPDRRAARRGQPVPATAAGWERQASSGEALAEACGPVHGGTGTPYVAVARELTERSRRMAVSVLNHHISDAQSRGRDCAWRVDCRLVDPPAASWPPPRGTSAVTDPARPSGQAHLDRARPGLDEGGAEAFWYTSQGSMLVPYRWFLELELAQARDVSR